MLPAAHSHIAGERKRSRWNKARLSLVLPIGAIVAVAIVCVVIAVLTSAKRADEVSLNREQHLAAAGHRRQGRACAPPGRKRGRDTAGNGQSFVTPTIRNGPTAASANGCKPTITRTSWWSSTATIGSSIRCSARPATPSPATLASKSNRASICCVAVSTPCRNTPLRSSPGKIRQSPAAARR